MNYTENLITPFDNICTDEYNNIILKYLSLFYLMSNKKTNISSIFVSTISNPEYFKLYKLMVQIEDDHEAIRLFMMYDPSVCKSKYLKKVINKNKNIFTGNK